MVDQIKAHGGIEQSDGKIKPWSRAYAAFKVHQAKCKQFGHCSDVKKLAEKEEVLFDMWALKHADFLVGSWMSTLTRNVCHWKGKDGMYNGNMCFLKEKWEDTVSGKNDQWFTTDGLNTTALFDPPYVTPFVKF